MVSTVSWLDSLVSSVRWKRYREHATLTYTRRQRVSCAKHSCTGLLLLISVAMASSIPKAIRPLVVAVVEEQKEREEKEEKKYEPKSATGLLIQRFVTRLEYELNLPSPQFDYQTYDEVLGVAEGDTHLIAAHRFMEEVITLCLFRRVGFFVVVAWCRVQQARGEDLSLMQLMLSPELQHAFTQLIVLMYTQSQVWMKQKSDGGKVGWEMRRDQMNALMATFTSVSKPLSITTSVRRQKLKRARLPYRLPAAISEAVGDRLMVVWACQGCLYDTSPWDGRVMVELITMEGGKRVTESQSQQILSSVQLCTDQVLQSLHRPRSWIFASLRRVAFVSWTICLAELGTRSDISRVSALERQTLITIQRSLARFFIDQ